MYTERKSVAITTDASGDGTGYIGPVRGRVLTIEYVKTDYADGVDVTVTGESSGVGILALSDQNASGIWHPRSQVHDQANGSAMTYDGSNKRSEPVALGDERIKIVVAQGGDTKTGTFYAVIG